MLVFPVIGITALHLASYLLFLYVNNALTSFYSPYGEWHIKLISFPTKSIPSSVFSLFPTTYLTGGACG